VAQAVTSGVIGWNQGRADAAKRALGSVGVVLGATADLHSSGIDLDVDPPRPGLPVLAPGFGHQGAELRDLRAIFGSLAGSVIVSESRSLLGAGPDGLAEAIRRRVDEVGAASV
jgi:orotidine-5'-phosphate decarboxylase